MAIAACSMLMTFLFCALCQWGVYDLRRDGNENVTNFAYLMSKSNSFARSVRAFLVFVHFFHVFGKSATWNDQFVLAILNDVFVTVASQILNFLLGSLSSDNGIHVQYCQLDSIGKNRSSIRPICSIWWIGKFLDDPTSRVFYPTIASHYWAWPLACLSIQPIGSIRRMENFIYDPTRRVSICSIRRMENIMLDLTYCVLHPKIASY